jgi:hypothetical protein
MHVMAGQEHTLVIKGVDGVLEIVMNVFFKIYIFYVNILKLYKKTLKNIFLKLKIFFK